jgi:hypothetical protein
VKLIVPEGEPSSAADSGEIRREDPGPKS